MTIRAHSSYKRLLLLLVSVVYLFNRSCSLSILPALISRSAFLGSSTLLPSLLFPTSSNKTPDLLTLPLLPLPKSGCMGILVEVNRKDYVYLAIVDTASPFLTASREVLECSQESIYPDSLEQYGNAVGSMIWRRVKSISICDLNQREYTFRDVILGVPDSNVIEETGGIYLGLLAQDRNRPTVLQELGYTSFCLDYGQATLTLSKKTLIDDQSQSSAMTMFDFSPLGSNVFHYGVECHEFDLQLSSGKTLQILFSSLNRPVVVILDSGLTGCVLNDSLWNELQERHGSSLRSLHDVTGARLHLGATSDKMTLASQSQYWNVSSFQLPWFDYDPEQTKHPHVIAAGNTFLSQSKMTIDTRSRQILLQV